MEMISRELQAGFPLELLYADDLTLLAESEESLCDKIVKWKSFVPETSNCNICESQYKIRRILPEIFLTLCDRKGIRTEQNLGTSTPPPQMFFLWKIFKDWTKREVIVEN